MEPTPPDSGRRARRDRAGRINKKGGPTCTTAEAASARADGGPPGRAGSQPIQYRRTAWPPPAVLTECSTPPQRSITAADAALSSSQVMSTRSTPSARATTRLCRRISLAYPRRAAELGPGHRRRLIAARLSAAADHEHRNQDAAHHPPHGSPLRGSPDAPPSGAAIRTPVKAGPTGVALAADDPTPPGSRLRVSGTTAPSQGGGTTGLAHVPVIRRSGT